MKLMIVNGSLGGELGNTAKAITLFCEALTQSDSQVEIDLRHLTSARPPNKQDFQNADAFLFASGVYWDSWGSPLQKFFETLTELEGNPCLFGKPAAALITMHSVGGKEVLSRLQGVLNTFGLFVPPMSAMTYSFATQAALENSAGSNTLKNDFWCLDDLAVIAKNLVSAIEVSRMAKPKWTAWSVDRDDPKRVWLNTISS